MVRALLSWVFLLLPLAVYALPSFQTTFEEDVMVSVCGVYLMLRAANPFRRVLPQWLETSLASIFLIILYEIGWMGLWRGYGVLGWSVLGYPACLSAAYFLQIKERTADKKLPNSIILAWLCLAWLFILYSTIVYFVPSLYMPKSYFRAEFYGAALIGIVVAGIACALAMHKNWMQKRCQMIPFFAAFAFVCAMSWSANYQLWRTWYDASESARAWAPLQNEQEHNIRLDKQASYAAFVQYFRVMDAVEKKGRIPKRMGWDERIHSQLETQVRRTCDLRLLNIILNESADSDLKRISLISRISDDAFFQQYKNQSPNHGASQRLFLDAEYNDLDNLIYFLDRWGGVSQLMNGGFNNLWRPDAFFDDAVDLEIHNGVFVILRANRTIVSSAPVPWLQGELSPFLFGGDVVDIELFKQIDGALIVSSKGEIASFGQTPPGFPSWGELYFQEDVIVDLELDVDERGYYLLDAYGAVHGNHADGQTNLAYRSPPISDGLVPYWAGQRMAVDLEVDAQARGLNIYTREGELFTIAQKPFRETYRPASKNEHRGVALLDGLEGRLYSLESNGRMIQLPADVE
ncbi:MAG: hypothetical protein P9L94_18010 [Candidatus Hinthialibacter antarcticus]|nr:hypothetical protein [Candidatus Hinthialibacter antarcticus]